MTISELRGSRRIPSFAGEIHLPDLRPPRYRPPTSETAPMHHCRSLRASSVLFFLLFFLTPIVALGGEETAGAPEPDRFFLYPDIHQEADGSGFVVFVRGEDVWRAPVDGGVATRLTTHPGEELFPKISPDGRWIAFSAQYTGSRQVWVMPAEGGVPRQLTYYTDVGEMPPRGGTDYWILGWRPDGKILVRMNRTPWGRRMGRYFLVDPAGGLETPLPLPHGGSASYSPDGSTLAYTPVDREFRTWKRTLGGRAQDVWTYDLVAHESERLTRFRGTDNFPMWTSEDRIYFTSDSDFHLELWALERDAGGEWSRRQVTRPAGEAAEWDVLWPSHGPRNVVFVRGGGLYRLRLEDESVTPIPVRIADRDRRAPRFLAVEDFVGSAALSPSGRRVLFGARGDLFSVPAEHGPTRQLTATSGVRERAPAWSPDGRWIAYLSDATGEYEIYLRRHGTEADGSDAAPRRLTSDGDGWKLSPVWSPDSKHLAWADRDRRLFVLSVEDVLEEETAEPVLVDRGFRGDLEAYSFSPDGRWLVYERTREDTRLQGLSLYSLESGEVTRLGDGLTNDFQPAFSADGRYLFFVSDRSYNLRFSAFEFDYVYDRAARLYAAALDPAAPALFGPRSDEEEPSAESENDEDDEDGEDGEDGEKDGETKDDAKKDAARSAPVNVDPSGFVARTVALPGVDAGAYGSLRAVDGALFYLAFSPDGPPRIERYDLEKRKAETVARGAGGFEISADGEKLLYRAGFGDEAAWHVVDAKAGADADGKLDLSGLRKKVDPAEEWRQLFDDGWRIARDFFYDPEMHGLDWEAIGQRYRSLLPHLSDRSELDFLFGEMIGELAAGHTYVGGGDEDGVERVEGGFLGAELTPHESGRFRIARIFEGENWDDAYRSPLTEQGVSFDGRAVKDGVGEGDFLLAIDGEELTTGDNPYRLLEGKKETQVTLLLNDEPSLDGAEEVVVRTLGSELDLRYVDWVKSRMRLVDELSGGRIGYIHLPDTAIAGNRMLQKLFYAQATKEALIIDDRYNGGGFIPDQMIEYLSRTRLAYWAMRDIESMRTPAFSHDGPKVMLANAYSSSGGDALPYFFRKLGLGEIVGTRTWGGLIGITGGPDLADGGAVTVCTFRIYDENGEWVVENEGVEPDHEVFDLPELLRQGRDPSIEKAVELLLDDLERQPVTLPDRPEPPDLSEDAYSLTPGS